MFIGRGANVDTKAESLKILPNSHSACGKPTVFTVGVAANGNCTVKAGLNVNSLNNLASRRWRWATTSSWSRTTPARPSATLAARRLVR